MEAAIPSVVLLLPVYNGARFLSEQLDSLIAQTHQDWWVLISDDGSNDDSIAILETFITTHPTKGQLFSGPKDGISANVLSLLARVNPTTDFVAFCDQDDIWHTGKLARALAAIKATTTPTLYCSRSNLVNSKSLFLRQSPARRRQPSFQNALVQNIASGNTMVLNKSGWLLLQSQIHTTKGIPHHDWWAYQLISGAGGRVLHDDSPSLEYRQHATNAVGAVTGISGVLSRIKRAYWRYLSRDSTAQLTALIHSRACLTQNNAKRLDLYASSRKQGPLRRLRGVISTGLYRQSRLGTLGLWVSTLIGRF